MLIKINEAAVNNFSEMRCFFSALAFGLKEVTDYTESSTFIIEPRKGLKLHRVYEDNSFVYKLYDKGRKLRINMMEIIEKAYLPDMKPIDLSIDKTFKLLKYRFIEVKDKKNIKLKDFEPIAEALDRLHCNDYVYSDVRIENLLFPISEMDKAKLIDFDLADKVGTVYPSGYNNLVPDRHTDAQPGCRRKIIHDRFSLMAMSFESMPDTKQR